MFRSRMAIGLVAAVALLTVGCAKKSPQPAAAQAKAAAPAVADAAIPKGHAFGKITKGMPDNEVRKLLGEPTDRRDYITGKQFIPWYYGKDTSRSDWFYKGKGRIVFVRNRYSGSLTVIEVHYDPTQP